MKIWADSFHCRGGTNCVACRAVTPNGFIFRARLGKVWSLPQMQDEHGFRCPHDVPWDTARGKQTEMPHVRGPVGGGCCSPPPKPDANNPST